MSVEDFWWDAHNTIKEFKLQRKFDKQLKKMEHQEKHQYKDTRDKWAYALSKVVNEYQEKQNKKKKSKK